MQPIGDLARFFSSNRLADGLREATNMAALSATTGEVNDKADSLRGATLSLALMDRKIALLDQQLVNIAEAQSLTSATQATLGQVQNISENILKDLSISSQVITETERNIISNKSKNAFIDVVNLLNSEVAGRYLLSGSSTQKPLPDGVEVFTALQQDMSSATDANDLITRIDEWFNSSLGVFEALMYRGSNQGNMTFPIGSKEPVDLNIRADDSSIRKILTGLTLSALASLPTINMNTNDQSTLLANSIDKLANSNNSLIQGRANVGVLEEKISSKSVQVDAEYSRLSSLRQDLIGTDAFEQISIFEATQQQLDITYRIASRQGQTSLAEYLR